MRPTFRASALQAFSHASYLMVLLAGPAVAQREPGWNRERIVVPDFGGQLDLGLWLGLALQKPALRGPYPHAGELRGYGTYGITGSRSATLAFSAPGVWRDWRVLGLLRSERLLRTPYFGAGNEARQVDSLQDAHGNLYYRHAQLRSTAYVTVQRRVTGPVWLVVGAQARTWRTSSLAQQPSLYAADVAAGRLPRDTLRFAAIDARLGLLYDTRDEWVVPTRGVLVEIIGSSGKLTRNELGGRNDFQRFLLGAREFLPIDGRTVVALRQRMSVARDSLPYYLAWQRLTWWMPDDGVVGGRSVRLHGGGDQLATNEAQVSVEVRRRLKTPLPEDPQDRALWGLVYADGGSLWEPGNRATTRFLWSLGIGARLQTSRANLIGFDVGITDLGPNISALSYFGF